MCVAYISVAKSASVKRWFSSEVNNLILVWYHAEGEPPSWQEDRVPQIESGELWLAGRAEYITNCHVQVDILYKAGAKWLKG